MSGKSAPRLAFKVSLFTRQDQVMVSTESGQHIMQSKGMEEPPIKPGKEEVQFPYRLRWYSKGVRDEF